jgi:uncharacterized protein
MRGEVEVDLAAAPLVDHHCHGVIRTSLDRDGFEGLINEGFETAPAGTSHFDAPIGLALRRWCAPVLDLDPLTAADAYVERREELGADEVNRRFLRGSRLGALFVDSGYRSEELQGVEEMSDLSGAPAFQVVRLEAIAEEVAASGVSAAGYPEAFQARLEEASAHAVGLKTIVAYRGGFDFDPEPPARAEVEAAAGVWLRESAGSRPRLTDRVLLRYGIWTGADFARQRGFPLQIHAGFGDPDLAIHTANPALLTELLRALGRLPVNVVFLHCYPYHREAGYLAAVFPHVHFDVGSALNYMGPSAPRLLAEALELAPFTKQLYSSDAFGLAELFYLGAMQFRLALSGILEKWIERGECGAGEAGAIARRIGRENALRIYPAPL